MEKIVNGVNLKLGGFVTEKSKLIYLYTNIYKKLFRWKQN